MSNTPDLQPIAAGTGRALIQPPIDSAVWTADESTSYQLNARCQDFITRYLGRSLGTTTPDDPNMIRVNRMLLRLAFAVSIRRNRSRPIWLTYAYSTPF